MGSDTEDNGDLPRPKNTTGVRGSHVEKETNRHWTSSLLIMGSAASTSVAAVLVCHSSQESALRDLLADAGSKLDASGCADYQDAVVVTELYPCDLQLREDILSACQCAIVAVDPKFQTSPALIETLSFLKDNRKRVVAGPIQFFTRPSGAVGAICTAFGSWDLGLFTNGALLARHFEATGGCRLLYQSDLSEVVDKSRSQAEMDAIEETDQRLYEAAEKTESSHLLYVFADADGRRIAQEFVSLESHGTKSLVTQDLEADLQTLAASRVVVFVITADCVTNSSFRRLFEAALRWKKPFLPVNAGIRLTGWLALAMAGRLWYQVDLDHLEYLHLPYAQVPNCPCRVEDACLTKDFIACANGLLTAPANAGVLEATLIESRERALLQSTQEKALVHGLAQDQIEKLTSHIRGLVQSYESGDSPVDVLEDVGVATTVEAIASQREASQLPFPPATELLPEETELQLHHQHYEVTRQGISLPPSVLDEHGLPILNLQLDAMFSYQWSSQDVVLDVRQQGSVFSVRAWLDVFGHMQGNVNSAMAAAVENVACVVVFLTQKYVGSINCQLEFQYAARCRKPFILVFLTDVAQLKLPQWMTDAVGEDFNIYPTRVTHDGSNDRILALDYSAERINGVPLTNVLFGAIRVLAAQRNKAPLPVAYDGSLLLYATTAALHHAIIHPKVSDGAEDSVNAGAGEAPTAISCTRCGAAFHPAVASSLEGCRKHTAYYMGGTLLAGRWVCCQETKREGVGCQPANHTQEARAWTCDPSYGTYTWQPE